jgi:hypothetical protein
MTERHNSILRGRNRIPKTTKECPGLTRTSFGKWWVPNGETASSCTYCDFCKNKYNIQNVSLFTSTNSNCNCDYYKISKNLDFSLFNISLWSRDLKNNYTLSKYSTKDNSIFNVPSGKRFNILIDGSKLPQLQAYSIKITLLNDNGLKHEIYVIDTNNSDNVYITGSLLIKNIGNHSNNEIMFVSKPKNIDINSHEWRIVAENIPNKIQVEINVFNILKKDMSTISNTSIGTYSTNGKLLLTCPDNINIPRLFQMDYDNTDSCGKPITSDDYFNYVRVNNTVITKTFEIRDEKYTEVKKQRIFNKLLKENIRQREFSLRKQLKKIEWLSKVNSSKSYSISKTNDDFDTKSISVASKLSKILELKSKQISHTCEIISHSVPAQVSSEPDSALTAPEPDSALTVPEPDSALTAPEPDSALTVPEHDSDSESDFILTFSGPNPAEDILSQIERFNNSTEEF